MDHLISGLGSRNALGRVSVDVVLLGKKYRSHSVYVSFSSLIVIMQRRGCMNHMRSG